MTKLCQEKEMELLGILPVKADHDLELTEAWVGASDKLTSEHEGPGACRQPVKDLEEEQERSISSSQSQILSLELNALDHQLGFRRQTETSSSPHRRPADQI